MSNKQLRSTVGQILMIPLCNKSYPRQKFDGLGMWWPMFWNAIVMSMVSSILTSGHRPSVLSPLPAEETKDTQDLKFSRCELKYPNDISMKKSYLRRYPNMRNSTQKMMQAMPMWIPTTIPASEPSVSLQLHLFSSPEQNKIPNWFALAHHPQILI